MKSKMQAHKCAEGWEMCDFRQHEIKIQEIPFKEVSVNLMATRKRSHISKQPVAI